MKQIKHLLGMAAMLLFAASCSSDEPVDPVNPVVDKDQTRYLSVAISSPAGTRTYEDGETEESDINEIVFMFFDRDKKLVYQTNTTKGKPGVPDTSDDNVTRVWNQVVPIDLVQGQNMPAYVVAFVNPIDKDNANINTLDDLEELTRTTLKGTEGFAMANSVYYGDNPFTGKKEKMRATPIREQQLFESEDDALKALNGDGVLTIYVERYAAKIKLTLDLNEIQDYPVTAADGSQVNLKFVPEFWRPNAVSKSTYVTKKFKTKAGNNTPTYQEMVDLFKGTGMADNWNKESDFRSFWGCSPSYYANKYPYVSDDVDDLEGNTQEYEIKYFSYKEISEGVGYFAAGNDDFVNGTPFYSRETTTHIDNINNIETGNPVASVASVVIVGHYLAGGATTASTFYLDHNSYYPTYDEALAKLIERQTIIKTDVNGTANDNVAAHFVLEHPKAAVRGTTPVAGRFVTLQVNSENVPTGLYYYNGTEYELIDGNNVAAVNRALWQQVHTMEIYNNGRAFFNIPIKHLGYGNEVAANRPLESGTGKEIVYNWEYMRRGDFGVVRNHVYNINVSSIKGLATGLRSDDQPIVPPKDAVNYWVAAKLNVLAWNVINTQNVEL